MVQTALIAHRRKGRTKSETRGLRKAEKVPAVVYGKVLKQNILVFIDHRDIELILGSESGKNTIINLALPDNKKVQTMIREVQKNPMTGKIIHIDFHQISLKDKIHTEVPLVFSGEPAGLINGGILQHGIRAVEISCLPTDIPEHFEVSIGHLDIGDYITVEELPEIPGITILSDPETILLSVVTPRLEVEPSEEEGETLKVEVEEAVEEKEKEEILV